MICICNDWEFTPRWSEEFQAGLGEAEGVRLPHTVKELPLHYAGPEDYEMVCGYRRRLSIPEEYRGKRLFLRFDGAAHIATVYLNGAACAVHRCGYTAFRAEITELVRYGGENLVSVRLDCRENGEIPPFGHVIDYLTYGGLYREVWLDIREQQYIEDIYITTPAMERVHVALTTEGRAARVRILDPDGNTAAEAEGGTEFTLDVPGARLWDCDSPTLYTCAAELLDEHGAVIDSLRETFGFRSIAFKADGFYLNGKKTFLRGLNRHQCYPTIGYAAPEHLQREDARILRHELQCNAVRTSHYPQSRYFIDECDRQGLLVFTEIPGWQHIGDEKWKEQACENTREMVLQYRNHPSIILWGVRINESLDDDEFYRRTNAIAHELDPSRPTTGVRYLEKSHLLEDVYAYNDFSHTGDNPGAKPKNKVTPDMDKALLISECNGHMYPTKPFDPWERRQEQALRHARVQDAAMASGGHAGCFGWCMFDYPTHRDFGSGDRVCYHGVMDAFRNPKLASAFYASQGEEAPVLEIGSSMDIGDYPAGQIGSPWLFTNADEVELYKNDCLVTTFRPRGWKGLHHGPIPVDDTIGRLLETQEGFGEKKAELLRRCLVSAGKHGLANMPLADKLRMLTAMVRYRMSMQDGVDLYGKYVGNWGGEATRWRFAAKKQGVTVAERICCPGKTLRLEVKVSQTALSEGDRYDMAAVRIRLLDEYGNPAVYAQLPVHLRAEGQIALVGPDTVTAEGGMCGCYVKTTGQTGRGSLLIRTAQTEDVEIEFSIGGQNETGIHH